MFGLRFVNIKEPWGFEANQGVENQPQQAVIGL